MRHLAMLVLSLAFVNAICSCGGKISAREAEALAKSDESLQETTNLHEKSVPPDTWEKLHAQVFQNEQMTVLIKDRKVYSLGGGTETYLAAGSGGPQQLTVADLNADGASDLVYLNHTVLSGPEYDSLEVFDGKRNLRVHGGVYPNPSNTLKLSKNSNGQAEITIDGRKSGLSLGGRPGFPPEVVLTPIGRP